MAQGLYGEWFVKVLFPGHEKARVVDSPLGKIPEGLGLATFAEVLSDLDLGSQPKGGIGQKIFEKRGINAITAPKDGESSPFTHGK